MIKFPLRLITFDVNGTLLKPNGSIGAIYADFAERRGLKADPQVLNTNFRAAYKSMDRSHPNFGLESGLGWRSWWTQVVNDTFSSSSTEGHSAEKLARLAEDLIQHFSSGDSWTCEDGALDLLNTLSSSYHLGVISNTDPRLHRILQDKNLSTFFTFVLTSYEASFPKPHQEIFLESENLYQKCTGEKVNQEQTIHIGNSYDLDYLPAKKLGWQSLLVNCSKVPAHENVPSFRNLSELRDVLCTP